MSLSANEQRWLAASMFNLGTSLAEQGHHRAAVPLMHVACSAALSGMQLSAIGSLDAQVGFGSADKFTVLPCCCPDQLNITDHNAAWAERGAGVLMDAVVDLHTGALHCRFSFTYLPSMKPALALQEVHGPVKKLCALGRSQRDSGDAAGALRSLAAGAAALVPAAADVCLLAPLAAAFVSVRLASLAAAPGQATVAEIETLEALLAAAPGQLAAEHVQALLDEEVAVLCAEAARCQDELLRRC